MVTEPFNTLEAVDNGNGTFTTYICLSTISPYNVPACLEGGVEVVCGTYAFTLGGSCTTNGECIGGGI